jgi:hypothetical protein
MTTECNTGWQSVAAVCTVRAVAAMCTIKHAAAMRIIRPAAAMDTRRHVTAGGCKNKSRGSCVYKLVLWQLCVQ